MLDIINIENKPFYCLGDIHGEYNVLERYIEQHDLNNCIIAICGDIGLGFLKKDFYINYFNKLNIDLLKRNIDLILIRGNHDDKSYFDNKIIWLSNIKAVEDYTVIHLNDTDFNVLCVGGAISIDRTYRIKNYERRCSSSKLFYNEYADYTEEEINKLIKETVLPSYWEDEPPIYDENKLNELKDNTIEISHVLTHTCPKFCFPISKEGIKEWLTYDRKLEKDIDDEREVMSMIYQKLIEDNHPLKGWTYGHYHTHVSEEIKGIAFTTLTNSDYRFDYIKIN